MLPHWQVAGAPINPDVEGAGSVPFGRIGALRRETHEF